MKVLMTIASMATPTQPIAILAIARPVPKCWTRLTDCDDECPQHQHDRRRSDGNCNSCWLRWFDAGQLHADSGRQAHDSGESRWHSAPRQRRAQVCLQGSAAERQAGQSEKEGIHEENDHAANEAATHESHRNLPLHRRSQPSFNDRDLS
jgi:hypothetical protein